MMFTTLISPQDLANCCGSSDLLVIDCRFELSDTSKGENAWHAAHLAEMRITSPKRGAWYLDVHAVYTDTALGSGGGIGDASYAYRAFDVSLNRAW